MTLEQPSPENLLMAAAIMHEQGKFAQNYGALSKEEWSSWTNLSTKEGPVYADKANKDLPGMLKNNPDGFVVHKENPHLHTIQDDAEILTIPGQDSNLFVRPRVKPPLTS